MFKIMEAVITLKSCELRVVGYQKKKKKKKKKKSGKKIKIFSESGNFFIAYNVKSTPLYLTKSH